MAVTTDKYSAQLSADATSLARDLATGGKEIDKWKNDVDKKLEKDTGGGAHKIISGLRKDFKGAAKDIAFIGMAADHLEHTFGGPESGLGKLVSTGKEVALAWAIGGPILGGAVAFKEVVMELPGILDKVAGVDRGQRIGQAIEKFNETGDILKAIGALSEKSGPKFDPAFLAKTNIELHAMTVEMQKQASIAGLNPLEKFKVEVADKIKDGSALNKFEGERAIKAFEQLQKMQAQAAGMDFIKGLDEQSNMLGKTAEEAMICKMALNGLSQEGVKAAEAALKNFQNAKLNEDVNQFTKSLTEQADAYGMTANEAKLLAFAQKGATDEQLRSAAEQSARLDALNTKAPGANNALRVGSAAGVVAINQARRDAIQSAKAEPDKAQLQADGNILLQKIHDKLDEMKNNPNAVDIFQL